MCGITGWISFERDLAYERKVLDEMTQTMACRGPDAAGTWIDGPAALGHRRLAVIDVAGGTQPMSVRTPTGEVALVYSGEAYNFAELRQELRAAGERFSTSSDTEVVLRGYVRWGKALAERLNGMYRLRRLGRPYARARDDPRPHGDQAALLLPDRRRRAVRLRAQGDPRQSARAARRRPRRAPRAVRVRQDAGARRVVRHARGRAGHDRHRRLRRHPPAPLLAPGDAAAPRRQGRHRHARARAARRHRAAPARRGRAALRAALGRPGLVDDHRPVGDDAGRGGRARAQLRRRLRRADRELQGGRAAPDAGRAVRAGSRRARGLRPRGHRARPRDAVRPRGAPQGDRRAGPSQRHGGHGCVAVPVVQGDP